MKMKSIKVLSIVILLAAFSLGAVSDALRWIPGDSKIFCVVRAHWVARANGTVDTFTTRRIDGYIVRVVTNPGTPAPTDNYDVTLGDEDGVEVMGGTLSNRDTTASEQSFPLLYDDGTDRVYGSPLINGPLTMEVIDNIVPFAAGDVVIYITRK
jgi:hypothetical protein